MFKLKKTFLLVYDLRVRPVAHVIYNGTSIDPSTSAFYLKSLTELVSELKAAQFISLGNPFQLSLVVSSS